MKQKILIVYTEMVVGGSTTSLLSLLNEIDYLQYSVDLLLLNQNGVLQKQIPSQVNIIDNSFLFNSRKSIRYYLCFIYAFIKSKIKKNNLIRSQVLSAELAYSQAHLQESYDIAIAFLEFWPSWFVTRCINAKKKILWLHVDYASTGLNIKHDKKMYELADTIVTVSEACRDNLVALLPEQREKIVCINNILSQKTIRALAAEKCRDLPDCEAKDFVFVTVARIVFNHKGHDRAIFALKHMKQEYPNKSFVWIVLGNGPDYKRLQELIHNSGLDDQVVLLGEKMNPHPYVNAANIFLLPSRYEGKPMSVTEAQMNGVIPLVTEYASSHDQIVDGIDGIICENSEDGILRKLDELFSDKINLRKIKENLSNKDYSNSREIEMLYKVMR
ncbi:MAG: glycosyltransferase [Acidaminococcaceae bacterium]